jgi:hypothetical protein
MAERWRLNLHHDAPGVKSGSAVGGSNIVEEGMRRRVARTLGGSLLLVILGLMLVACGSSQSGNTPAGGGESSPARATPRAPAPRSKAVPSGDPYDFEAPFSIGTFVRQTMHGNVTSTQLGGLQATYAQGSDNAVLTVYYFTLPDQAVQTVQFALGQTSIARAVGTPYYSSDVAFGVAQDRRGGYLAAWSHGGWCFLAQTTGSLDALNAFLDAFPY